MSAPDVVQWRRTIEMRAYYKGFSLVVLGTENNDFCWSVHLNGACIESGIEATEATARYKAERSAKDLTAEQTN